MINLKASYFVLGLGKSGFDAAVFLKNMGARVVVWDDTVAHRDTARANGLAVEEIGPCLKGDGDILVLSPGIPHMRPKPHPWAQIAQDLGIPIICDMEILCQWATSAHMAGITGTNGKSTTTALTTHIISRARPNVLGGGNIGWPTLSLPRAETYVLELSSYQLERMHTKSFDAGVLLNITPDHLDRHGDMKGYATAKAHLFDLMKSHGVAFISVDDPMSADIQNNTLNSVPISVEKTPSGGIYVSEGKLIDDYFEKKHVVCHLDRASQLKGAHNYQNSLAAYAICRKLGLSEEEFLEGLDCFSGLPHRQTFVDAFDGATFINDSKATNILSATKALDSFEDIYWIIGGQAKEPLTVGAVQSFLPKLKNVYGIGASGQAFCDILSQYVPALYVETMDKAVMAAYKDLKKTGRSGVVLLSPMCASFDQYQNFEARGRDFEQCVSDLKKIDLC